MQAYLLANFVKPWITNCNLFIIQAQGGCVWDVFEALKHASLITSKKSFIGVVHLCNYLIQLKEIYYDAIFQKKTILWF